MHTKDSTKPYFTRCHRFVLGISLAICFCGHPVSAQEVYESVEFSLFLQRQPLCMVDVVYGNERYLVSLVGLSRAIEYRIETDSVVHIISGVAYADDSQYRIRGDSLEWHGNTRAISNEIFWNPQNGQPYVSDSLLRHLHAMKTEWTTSALSLNITPPKTTPYTTRIQEKRRIQRLLSEREARRIGPFDTIKLRNFKINSIGYSISPYFNTAGPTQWSMRGNIGGEVLRGSFGMNYDYTSLYARPTSENITVGWARSIERSRALKSLRLYHDYSDLLTTTKGYITGISLSNQRGSSYLERNYSFQGKTIPNADVEIYSNGQLLNLVRSDSMGHYNVEIPMYTGDNKLSAVSYDTYGVPVSNEQLIYVPPDLQQKGQLGYRFSAGYTDDGAIYATPTVAYGATDFLTLSAGNETVIYPQRTTSIAILSAKLSLLRNIRIDLNYIPAVRWGALLSGSIKNVVGGNIIYEHYNSSQTIIMNAPTERLQASLNGSLPFKRLHGNYYISAQYYKYSFDDTFSTYFGLYFWWRKMIANLSLNTDSRTMSIANPSYVLRVGYNITNRWYNEVTGEYRQSSARTTLRNRLNYQFGSKLSAYAEAEYVFKSNHYGISFGFMWRSNAFQLKAGGYNTRRYGSGYVNASGSVLLHDCYEPVRNDRYIAGTSLLVVPFVDFDGNGVLSIGEPIERGTTVVMRGAAEKYSTSRGILLANIPPDTPFKLIIPTQSFSDISWQITPIDTTLRLSTKQSRTLRVPIRVISELAGQVYALKDGRRVGVEGVKIILTNMDTGRTTILHSDEWGYYSAMVTCGTYRIECSREQLDAQSLTLEHIPTLIKIPKGPEGVQIDNLDIGLGINN